MPAPALRPWPGWTIVPSGTGVALLRDGRLVATVRTAGWHVQATHGDADELEQTLLRPGSDATLRCRHDVTSGWALRWALQDAEPVPLTLQVDPGPDHHVWLWAGEDAGLVGLVPTTQPGPVVALELRRGRLLAEDGRLTLTPAGSTSWSSASVTARLAADLGSLGTHLPGWLPAQRMLDQGEPLVIPLPDAAVDAGLGAQVRTTEHGSEIEAPPGWRTVRVHADSGTTRFDVCWLPGHDEILTAWAAELSAAGRIEDAAGWVVLERALRARLVADAERAHDLLDRNLDVLGDPGDPLVLLGWAAEVGRGGERTSVQRLRECLAAVPPVPGAAHACVQAALSLAGAGESVDPAANALARLVASGAPTADEPAVLEAHLVAGLPVDPEAGRALLGLVGAGLPGRSDEADAVLPAVHTLSLAPDGWLSADEAALLDRLVRAHAATDLPACALLGVER